MPESTSHTVANIAVTVCYAASDSRPEQKKIILKAGAKVLDALVQAGYAQLDWSRHGLGVYGKRKTPDSLLHDGDRVEIYAPLTVDPKLARQRRVDKQRREKPDRWIRR
jgi:putative ubiquitin-RnfH superfamily antitoxin RatB of RatAB toxin-antitoxin module